MGRDAIGLTKAWSVYGALASDPRVFFRAEPPGLEPAWKELAQGPHAATNVWTDAYLLAFAGLLELTLVTFDKGLAGRGDPPPLVLAWPGSLRVS
jgi:predicted nucleic acid-binding protein